MKTDLHGGPLTRILILGANGQLARHTTPFFLDRTDAHLTLYLRRASRLKNPDPRRVTIVEGDVLDRTTLMSAMHGQNVVYANLAGDMAPQARAIVDAMHAAGIKRLIFISSMGIYSEGRVRNTAPSWTHTASPQKSSRSPTWTTRSSGLVGSRKTTRSNIDSHRRASRSKATTCP